MTDPKKRLQQALRGVPMQDGIEWIEEVLRDWAKIDALAVVLMARRVTDSALVHGERRSTDADAE